MFQPAPRLRKFWKPTRARALRVWIFVGAITVLWTSGGGLERSNGGGVRGALEAGALKSASVWS